MSNRNTMSLQAIEGKLLPEELTYQAKLRQACFDGVSEQDVADVVKQIVGKKCALHVRNVRLCGLSSLQPCC